MMYRAAPRRALAVVLAVVVLSGCASAPDQDPRNALVAPTPTGPPPPPPPDTDSTTDAPLVRPAAPSGTFDPASAPALRRYQLAPGETSPPLPNNATSGPHEPSTDVPSTFALPPMPPWADYQGAIAAETTTTNFLYDVDDKGANAADAADIAEARFAEVHTRLIAAGWVPVGAPQFVTVDGWTAALVSAAYHQGEVLATVSLMISVDGEGASVLAVTVGEYLVPTDPSTGEFTAVPLPDATTDITDPGPKPTAPPAGWVAPTTEATP